MYDNGEQTGKGKGKMKGVEEYRRECRVLLGDAAGRRYSDEMLDMGLREALGVYRSYCPRKETVMQRAQAVDGMSVMLPAPPLDPGVEILTVRDADTGLWLEFAVYTTDRNTYINCYSGPVPAAGARLSLELSCPHFIKGLDEHPVTTVPDAHSVTVCSGAAGYAMRIRARSVTEVFGKRPEDREALMNQADQMITEYFEALSRLRPAVFDPMPRGGFPI